VFTGDFGDFCQVTSLDVTVADLSVVAGDSADVVVTLTGTHTQDITVDYATSDSGHRLYR